MAQISKLTRKRHPSRCMNPFAGHPHDASETSFQQISHDHLYTHLAFSLTYSGFLVSEPQQQATFKYSAGAPINSISD